MQRSTIEVNFCAKKFLPAAKRLGLRLLRLVLVVGTFGYILTLACTFDHGNIGKHLYYTTEHSTNQCTTLVDTSEKIKRLEDVVKFIDL